MSTVVDVDRILANVARIGASDCDEPGLVITFSDEIPLAADRMVGLLTMLEQWPEIKTVEASRLLIP